MLEGDFPLSRRPRLALEEIADPELSPVDRPGTRVRDPVAQRAASKRLRLHEDAAELARLEGALGLKGGEELLVVQVPVAEVPAEREARDDLTVDPFVVGEMV